MTFGDKVVFGSSEEIKENLLSLKLELKSCSNIISIRSHDDYIGFLLKKLSLYASAQVERLISFIELNIELNAWISRNLFESYLLSAYIVSSPIRAKDFLSQKATDELEIYKGILSLKQSANEDNTEGHILIRIQQIKDFIDKYDITQSKHWHVSMLAEQTGNKDEYEAFFKLYSKYVHPSSWIINGQENEIDNISYRNIFLTQAQYYCSCLLKIIENYQS